MLFNQIFIFVAVFVSGGLCASNVALSYTDSLLGGLSRGAGGAHGIVRPGIGQVKTILNECLLDCPLGTRCSLEFGTPRCVRITTGLLGTGISAVGTALNQCLLDCPLGTRCSLEFGSPQCISDAAAGLDLGIGAGLDQISNTIGLESSFLGKASRFGLNRCAAMTPACLATRLDRFEQCRFTFDPRQQRCVRVYVRNICAVFNGPRRNLFSTMVDCEQSCLGRLFY